MEGTIIFNDLKDLATFLNHFTGSTAMFEIKQNGSQWWLTFTGGF